MGWEATDEVATVPEASKYTPEPEPPGFGQQAQNFARRAADALTLGQWNRVRAGVNALTGPQSYSEALAEQAGKSEQAGKELPPFARGTADVIGGTAPGIGLGAATSRALGTAARPLLQRMGIGAAEGALLGGAQGAGQTYTGEPADYFKNAGMGSIYGAGIGAAAPAAGAIGSAAYRAAADMGMFGGFPKTMVRAAEADRPGLQTVLNTPGAMLPDAGPSMLGTAQGAVLGSGGPGRTALVENLRTRDVGTPGRIAGELNQAFGPAPLPSRVEAGVRENMRAMGPEYQAALNNARAIDNTALANRIETLATNERGDAQAALRQVRGMLDIPGNPGHLDPHPGAMQNIREAVRGMRDNPNADPNTARVMGNVYNELTQEMHRKIPGIRELDSRYVELGTQERALQPASQGARLFQTDRQNVVRPEELQQVMTEAAQPKGLNVGPSAEAFRLSQAARGELDRIVGTNKNDLLKLENVLGQPQDWNAQKLAVVFGQDRANQLMNVLQRERGFRQTYQDVVQGSQTAQRTAAKEAQEAGRGLPINATLWGTAVGGAQKGINALRERSADISRDRIAQWMATRDPAELRDIITRLESTSTSRDINTAAINAIIRGMVTGGGTGYAQGRNK